ncbi:AlpA family phage regulatory protein [Variovorax sp. LG9.2]|nr:AlpA family phage regulatory protein [Variovorax sp. LG9.2]
MTQVAANQPQSETLLRLPAVLAKVPVSRATWWNGIKSGRFPAGVKLGPRTTCWRASEIDALIRSL